LANILKLTAVRYRVGNGQPCHETQAYFLSSHDLIKCQKARVWIPSIEGDIYL